jgi:hypothetical protein
MFVSDVPSFLTSKGDCVPSWMLVNDRCVCENGFGGVNCDVPIETTTSTASSPTSSQTTRTSSQTTRTSTEPRTTSTESTTGRKDQSSSDSVGPTVGAVVGALGGIVLLVILILFFRRKKQSSISFLPDEPDTMAMQSMQGLLTGQVKGYEISHSSIVLENEIGSGEFGVVMKAIGLSLPGCDPHQTVAVKVLKQVNDTEVNAFLREGARLKELNHDNVVRLIGLTLSEPYYIVLEYMTHGDLKRLLRRLENCDIQLSLRHLFSLTLDVSRGFCYLQSIGFVHRDLAARNVLLSASFVAKISDFGSFLSFVRLLLAQEWLIAVTDRSTIRRQERVHSQQDHWRCLCVGWRPSPTLMAPGT